MGLGDGENKNTPKNYLVISDTHLGGNKNGSNVPNYDEFCSFLKWIKYLPEAGERIWVKKGESGYEKTIAPPSKIILLGDILDLWDPENADRNNVIKQIAKPFSLLQGVKCDKAYVVGNHDQDLYELSDALKNESGCLDMDTSIFEVHRRHYPETVDNGEEIGKLKYAFIHGHQYDKMQITEPLSKRFKIRFDPLDVIQDLSNVSMIKSVFKERTPTVMYGVLVILLIYWNSLQSILGSFLNLVQTPLWLVKILSGFLELSWAFILSFVVTTPAVKLIARYQGPAWKLLLRPRDKTVKQVIDEGYYNESYDKMNVDVVVFGHTHIADWYYLKSKKRLFINTGAWVNEKDGRHLNTFAYIDENCINILSWLGTKKDGMYAFEEICSHPVGSIHQLANRAET
jgi:UDP-2,3-diacylglucosamine pyrophosphatase LpxH